MKVDINFFTREPSFSLIYFTGHVFDDMPRLLESCGYAIIANSQHEGTYFETLPVINHMEGTRNTIVYKAAYPVPAGTVLLDPEMTIGVSHSSEIVRLCSEHTVEAIVAIWERVSETILCKRLTPEGVRIYACVQQGVLQGTPVNPPPDFLNQRDPGCLKTFLASAGATLDAIFGEVSGRIYRLDESAMHPEP